MSNPFNRREGFKGNVVLRPEELSTGVNSDNPFRSFLSGLFSRIQGNHSAGTCNNFTLDELRSRANKLFKTVKMDVTKGINSMAGTLSQVASSITLPTAKTTVAPAMAPALPNSHVQNPNRVPDLPR